MASKHSLSAETMTPVGADNFKLINGIGRAVEQRLHSAGILTFAQLGALSPDDIAGLVAGLAGLSAERIAKQDWIGQARELAAGPPPLEVRHDTMAPADRQHYATFTVELLLDEGNDVRRTRVAHVQGGAEDSWAGWRAAQLLEFFTGCAHIQTPPEEPTPAARETAPSVETSDRRAVAHIRALDLALVGEEGTRAFLHDDQPFEARLALAFSDLAAPADEPLVYSVAVYAKSLHSRSRHTVCEAHGALLYTDPAILRLAGARLSRGIYRLEAAVTITLPASATSPVDDLTAFWEGGLVQVY